ncbi:MAG: hypothetical protein PHW84_15525 [Methanosarcina sp.]|nr:hypothetical protein [Methanosarcina sp.]
MSIINDRVFAPFPVWRVQTVLEHTDLLKVFRILNAFSALKMAKRGC